MIRTMFSKKTLIFIGLIVAILGGYFLNRGSTKTITDRRGQQRTGSLPKAEIKIPTGNKMTVGTVEVENVYNTAVSINTEGDVLYAETSSYQQSYIYQGQYFLITILKSPFDEIRREAEEQFLRSTGLTQESACKVDVRVGTPYFANPNEAGKDYGLSFCTK